MATMTAQILVGGASSYHGGITPSHVLYLSENSRPAWMLMSHDIYSDAPPDTRRVVWIPTVERMLEDAIVMTAIHVLRNPRVLEAASSCFEEPEGDRVELYDDAKGDLDGLYEAARAIEGFPKLVISTFAGSTITRQLPILRKYTMDVEVCAASYRREWSEWQKETVEAGRLDSEPWPE
jgi:hypothetical protein